jgi:hypothetical protein
MTIGSSKWPEMKKRQSTTKKINLAIGAISAAKLAVAINVKCNRRRRNGWLNGWHGIK